jgi:hypothetical protein
MFLQQDCARRDCREPDAGRYFWQKKGRRGIEKIFRNSRRGGRRPGMSCPASGVAGWALRDQRRTASVG